VLRVRPCLPRERGAGNAQNTQALGGHGVHGPRQRGDVRGIEMAKIGDRFGRALGRDDEVLSGIGTLPDVRHREETWAKSVSVHEFPLGTRQVFGLAQLLASEIMKRPLHGIEGLSLTGEKAELDQAVEVLWHFCAGRLPGSKNLTILEPQLDDGHSVLGQSAGFVRTQHRCGAEGFDGGSTPGQDTRPRNSPRTHCRAHALLKRAESTEVIIFLMADAVLVAKARQKTPEGYYNLERMLRRVLSSKGTVLLCGTCKWMPVA